MLAIMPFEGTLADALPLPHVSGSKAFLRRSYPCLCLLAGLPCRKRLPSSASLIPERVSLVPGVVSVVLFVSTSCALVLSFLDRFPVASHAYVSRCRLPSSPLALVSSFLLFSSLFLVSFSPLFFSFLLLSSLFSLLSCLLSLLSPLSSGHHRRIAPKLCTARRSDDAT